MGNPTYRGLLALQGWLAERNFPLAYKVGVCRMERRTYSCGLPVSRDFVPGELGNLQTLAMEDPYGEPANVALAAEDGSFGLRFIESVYLRDTCPLFVNDPDSSTRVDIPRQIIEVEAFGTDAFEAFAESHLDVILNMARYGKEDPRFWERVKMTLLPSLYHFPELPALAA